MTGQWSDRYAISDPKTLSPPGPMSYLYSLALRIWTPFWRREDSNGMDMWNAPMVQSRQPLTYRLMENVGLGGPRWHGNSWQRRIAESESSRPSTLLTDIPGDLVWYLPCVQQASYHEGGPLVWLLPLYLHVNQKSDYDIWCTCWCKREHVESNALNNWKLKIFKIIDEHVLFYSNNLDLLPPKPKSSFQYLKQGIQEFHRKYVLAPADKAANNVVVVWQLYYINTLIHKLGSTKTYEQITTDERSIVNTHSSIVNTHSIEITAKFAVSTKEKQDRLPTLYWLPKLHKLPYKACFVANSSSCMTTVLSKLLTSCLTAVKNHWIRYYDIVYERDIFGQLKIPMMFSINLNLKTFRLLNRLHMIFLHCILRYLMIL